LKGEFAVSVIDADTHVDESESTWAKLEGTPYEKYMPSTVNLPPEVAKRSGFRGSTTRKWVVEDRMQNRATRDEVNHPLRVRRELEDVEGRVAQMDEMGVDVQVIFPTFFIRYATTDAEAEWALTTTYNRWLAEKCATTNGRLQWAAVLPFLQPDAAVEELRWAKENGACGIFKRGFDLGRPVTDPHFFPVYEEASALDLPLCMHTGHPLPDHEWDRGFPIMSAFSDLISARIPEKFPGLRFGFIEAGASWIPYMVSQIGARQRAAERGQNSHLPHLYELAPELFRENRAFITVDLIDDIESILMFGTEDSLMIGTDYSHTDISANLSALAGVRDWMAEGRINEEQAEKILVANPKAFYGL
jgi:predicted TIM-barrel fold metal-dependent hydrolase